MVNLKHKINIHVDQKKESQNIIIANVEMKMKNGLNFVDFKIVSDKSVKELMSLYI